jgi:predicted transcriptional regulator
LEINEVDKICNDLGINQKKLAEMIGVSQNTVSTWKNAKQKLPTWTKNIFELLREQKECQEYKKTVKQILS